MSRQDVMSDSACRDGNVFETKPVVKTTKHEQNDQNVVITKTCKTKISTVFNSTNRKLNLHFYIYI